MELLKSSNYLNKMGLGDIATLIAGSDISFKGILYFLDSNPR